LTAINVAKAADTPVQSPRKARKKRCSGRNGLGGEPGGQLLTLVLISGTKLRS
jgi:hypothetical protein